VSSLTFETLRYLVAESLDRSESEVQPDMRLVEDLGIDSLAMHALLIDIEESGGVIPPPEILERVSTVRQLYAAVVGDTVS
jgi:acyl carrier protein